MKLRNLLILILSFCFLAYIVVTLHFWAMEYKDLFFYLNDWTSWIFAFILVMAITGVLKWIFKWELRSLLK
ncbi:MAG TPA: hypothetical protein PKK60_02010 [archaeon]|mgnify:CR=1 FL=1|nr:hypothetical protein [archaeon]